jgi:SPP1 family predicted phage head-tail adaptor
MRAGPLRHLVAIEAPEIIIGDDGGRSESWTHVGDAWVSIEPLRGTEFFAQQATQSTVTHRIRMRAFPGLTSRHRLRRGDKAYNLTSVLDTHERGIMYECMATESGCGD